MPPSRGDDGHKCDSIDAERLSPATSSATARQKRRVTSKSNAKHVKKEYMVMNRTTANTGTAFSVRPDGNEPRVFSSTQDVPCYGTPTIKTCTPMAWHGEFPGGSGIGSQDYDSVKASSPHKGGVENPDCDETDAVVSVYDLGLSAVPWSTHPSLSDIPSPSDVSDYISCKEFPVNHLHSAAEIEAEIRHKIESNLSWSEMDQEEFLPVDSFEDIFSIGNILPLVKTLYQNVSKEDFIQKARQIWCDETGSRRRIFATLVFMKQTRRIEDFIQQNIFDHNLPLCQKIKSRKEFRMLGDDRVNKTLFQNWERTDIDLFYVYQKMIFVPFLSMGNGTLCSYVFDGNVRLPWDRFEHETTGGHGTIHRMEIHPSHHDYKGNNNPDRPPCFAVKEINGADHESYRKELRALEMSCAKVQKEKHLIKLLLTFQHGNKPYLVFEWADGNLEQFWKTRQVTTSPSATKWMAEQLRGIANAIKLIHGLATWQKEERTLGQQEASVKDWGRHGDIKPANILWFLTHGKDRDHLVVADLGLTRYHSSLTKSRVMRVDGYTGTYRAPEIDLGSPISPKYDIWSLGCVFLEFCIWYLLGFEDVENFRRDRNLNRWSDDVDDIAEPDYSYFVTSRVPGEGRQALLHPAVHKWIERMRSLASCEGFVCLMLDLIMSEMLVIEPKERLSIDMISTELSNIQSSLEDTSEGFIRFQGTTNKIYQSPGPKVTKDHLQVPGSSASFVTFAEGNSKIPENTTSSVYRRDRALSIESSNAGSDDGSWNDRSTATTSVLDEELEDHAPRPNMIPYYLANHQAS